MRIILCVLPVAILAQALIDYLSNSLLIIMTTCAICLDACESEKTLGFDNCSHRCICLRCAHEVLARSSFIVSTPQMRYRIAPHSGVVQCPLCRRLSNAYVGESLVVSRRDRNKCIRTEPDGLAISSTTLKIWQHCGVNPQILSVSVIMGGAWKSIPSGQLDVIPASWENISGAVCRRCGNC